MRKFLIPVLLLCCFAFSGCEQDSRAKRGSSLLRAKTDTAKQEMKEAKTSEEKAKVAEDYFETAPDLVNALDDYLHGRDPGEDPK